VRIAQELYQSRLRETVEVLAAFAYNDVIEDTDADIFESLDNLVGGVEVFLAGFTFSTWMIVDERDAAGMMDAGFTDDVCRIDDRCADASSAHFRILDDFVPYVEQDDVEELLSGVTEQKGVFVTDMVDTVFRRRNALGRKVLFLSHAPGEIKCCQDGGDFTGAQDAGIVRWFLAQCPVQLTQRGAIGRVTLILVVQQPGGSVRADDGGEGVAWLTVRVMRQIADRSNKVGSISLTISGVPDWASICI